MLKHAPPLAQIGSVSVVTPLDRFHPAVGMQSEGEELKLDLNAKWGEEQRAGDVTLMAIDSCEEDWSRLHDIRVNGQARLPAVALALM